MRAWMIAPAFLLLAACQSRPPAVAAVSGEVRRVAPAPPPGRIAAIPLRGPGELIGREEAEVRAAMGAPKMIRRETIRPDRQVQVWQYASAGCVLDLYIYQDRGTSLVTYVAMRDREGKPAEPACFAEIRRDGAAEPG